MSLCVFIKFTKALGTFNFNKAVKTDGTTETDGKTEYLSQLR